VTRLPQGKTRLDLVREGLSSEGGLKKRGRLIVSVSKLIEDPRNERKTFRNMEGLVASVKAVGLIEPITVTPSEGDRYQIITGHRRYRAAKAAGLEQMEVLIREPQDELSRRQKSVISNVQREDVGPVEMAEALQSLMEEHPNIKTQDDLSRLIGKGKPWVSDMLRILTLPANLQQEVRCTEQSISYDSMSRIARIDDAHQQRELIQALLGGASQKEIRQRIDETKGNRDGKQNGAPKASKPKKVYYTKHKATVIVQATGGKLTIDQCVEALREALKQASK
jgi:ParB family chromosome partitioning protein